MGRWIAIARPSSSYPFAALILSQPHDLDRVVQRRRPPRVLTSAHALSEPWQRSGALRRRVTSGGVQRVSEPHLMLLRAPPPGVSAPTAPVASVLLWQKGTRGSPSRCSLPSWVLKLGAASLSFLCTPPRLSKHPHLLFEPLSPCHRLPPLPPSGASVKAVVQYFPLSKSCSLSSLWPQ